MVLDAIKQNPRVTFFKEINNTDVPVGAHIIIWGYGSFFSRLVGLLQYFWLGVKKPPTHIQRAISKTHDISAESTGVMMVNRAEKLKKVKRVRIVLHDFYKPENIQQTFIENSKKYLGKKYDFFFYIDVTLRILTVFIPIFLIWIGLFDWKAALLTFALLVVIYWPFRKWLKSKAKRTWACSELSNKQDTEMGLDTGIEIHHNTSPLYYYRLSRACPKYKVVYDSEWISKK